MTIGKKIKYFREKLVITQNQLAKATSIHPVSIRKYETNKMQPQPPQIEKIAVALGVSPNALIGLDNSVLRFKTVGDLFGIIILLVKSKIIYINGERGKDNLLKSETVTVHLNPVFSSYTKIKINSDAKANEFFPLADLSFVMKDKQMFLDLLRWESLNSQYDLCHKKYGDSQDETIKVMMAHLTSTMEEIELELQQSPILLDSSKGLRSEFIPDYSKF